MGQRARTFRVFISSTFSDLKEERNALQERVFPRLRALALDHGSRFQAIDLRWGVSQEASIDQQTMNICLNEIQRCQKVTPRPNFLVLMGDRYGWMPPPPQIHEDEFNRILAALGPQDRKLLVWEEKQYAEDRGGMMRRDPDSGEWIGDQSWYRLDHNALPAAYVLQPWEGFSYEEWGQVERYIHTVLEKGARAAGLDANSLFKYWASATHQEIQAGALTVRDADQHVYCFMREISSVPGSFDAVAFLADFDLRLAEVYPEGLGDQNLENHAAEIRKIPPTANAREIHERIQSFWEEAKGGTVEREFLEEIQSWLVDFSAKEFVNLKDEDWGVDYAAYKRQNALKRELEGRIPGNINWYQSEWTGRGITTGHIDQLCEDVYSALSDILLREIQEPVSFQVLEDPSSLIQPEDVLDEEGAAHRVFAEERLANFVGRSGELGQIGDYLKGRTPRILGIYGPGGTGKSALAARALQEAQQNHPRAEIVYRFIGAVPGSSDGRRLLESICREISRRYEISELDIPLDYQDLVIELPKRMALATEKKPLILILDSLDQLSEAQDARKLAWLMDELPYHVRILTTTRQEEDTFVSLKARKSLLLELGGLSREEGRVLLLAWLKEKGRTLQEPQVDAVLESFEASGGAPLYLKLASEEARLWPSGDGQPGEKLAVGIEGIIENNLIDRLTHESGHGLMLVSRVLGYLASSRYGLAEDEIMDLLSRDLEMYELFFATSFHLPVDLVRWAARYRRDHPDGAGPGEGPIDMDEERITRTWLKEIRTSPEQVSEFLKTVLPEAAGPRLPVVLWSRLFLDLEPYLSERESEGSILLTFYHRELRDVSEKMYLANGETVGFHKKLAKYYRFRTDPYSKGEWIGEYPRGLSELPYHLTRAGMWDEVHEVLTDFRFLEQKVEQVGILESRDQSGSVINTYTGVFQLQEDFERALPALSDEDGSCTVSGELPLILTAVERSGELTVCCPVCYQTLLIEEDELDTVITCPQPGCSRQLKINPFVNRAI